MSLHAAPQAARSPRPPRRVYPKRPTLAAEDLISLQSPALDVFPERCVVLRNRNSQCVRCVDACPCGAIRREAGHVAIDSSACVGCGTCATACPTGALVARQPADAVLFARMQQALSAQGEDLVVVCDPAWRRAGQALDRSKAVRVSCLARVDESLILRAAASGAKRILLVRGSCECCPGSRAGAVAEKTVERASDALSAWGSRTLVELREKIPPVVRAARQMDNAIAEQNPKTSGATDVPASVDGAAASAVREESVWTQPVTVGLSGGLVGKTDKEISWTPPSVMADGTMPHFLPDRRERTLDALSQMGEPDKGTALAGGLWAGVQVNTQTCISCTMCATFCPTGALSKAVEADGNVQLMHRPADCVACGCCADVCPAEALLLKPGADAGVVARGEEITIDLPPVHDDRGGAHSMIGALRKVMKFEYVYER